MSLFLVRHGRPVVDPAVPAARSELDPAGADVVLVGHATAWTALAAALTGREPDLDRWRALAMPDLIVVEPLPSKR